MSLRHAFVLAALVSALGPAGRLAAQPAESWATASARQLTEQGDSESAAGRLGQAIERYAAALQLDGTFGPAYLGLAQARERTGDPREAERVYAEGLDRVGSFWEAQAARARLRKHQGRDAEARADLAAAARVNSDPALLEELAGWLVEAGRFVEALRLCRQLRPIFEASGDAGGLARVLLRTRALAVLAAECDLVRAPPRGATPARRSIAAIARRVGL